MMNDRILKSWASCCSRQLLLSLGLSIAGILVFGVLAAAALLLPMPAGHENDRDLVFAGGLALFFLLSLIAILLWGTGQIRSQASRLDPAFFPYGMQGKGYLTSGRQYHGALSGRKLDVYFYRGPILDIYLSTSIQTYMGLGYKTQVGALLGRMSGMQPLSGLAPALEPFVVTARDEPWARSLLSIPEAVEKILNLTSNPGPVELPALIFQPGTLLFRLYHVPMERITQQNVQVWLNYLLELTRIAEGLPLPEQLAA